MMLLTLWQWQFVTAPQFPHNKGMLATINGMVTELLPGAVIVELNGLGYEIRVSSKDLARLPVGKKTKLFLYEHIREDSHVIYGFSQLEDKLAFEQLLGVSGVGPKVAQAIMNAVTVEQLQAAIAGGKADIFQAVPGVGNKMAARIVIDLRNKIGSNLNELLSDEHDATFSALKQLGFTTQQAGKALSKVASTITSDEERLKAALKELGK